MAMVEYVLKRKGQVEAREQWHCRTYIHHRATRKRVVAVCTRGERACESEIASGEGEWVVVEKAKLENYKKLKS